MSKFQPQNNSGTLFKNDRKEKDTHPDSTGTALIDGVEYWVSGWTKSGAKGKFVSMAFKRKDGADSFASKSPPAAKQSRVEDDDSDIPF